MSIKTLFDRHCSIRDRIPVALGLAGVVGIAWVYLLNAALPSSDMSMADMGMISWSASDFVLMFLMWAMMMIGMMVPSAVPMIFVFAAYNRSRRHRNQLTASVPAFVTGYIIMWVGFAALATLVQWQLVEASLLSDTMVTSSPWLGGALLIAAGLYQFTPIKNVCLARCRSPFNFIAGGFRPGKSGALLLGLGHGAFCVGCCWVLMGLLFVGGVMNLFWIAAIAVFILLEKVLPFSAQFRHVSALLFVLAGVLITVNH
jgi:predicted metal-binding membrane protein